VHVKQEEKDIQFAVQDSGPGIPQESLQTVFEKFIRLTNERSPHGLGIGLAFCRLAIEAHGGKIWVESVLGQGSTFYFSLPVDKVERTS
jgi:signal transduction histidine kinase